MFKLYRLKTMLMFAMFALINVVVIGSAHADLLLDTETAIDAAAADALTVGGYVVGGIATILVIGLVIRMIRKL